MYQRERDDIDQKLTKANEREAKRAAAPIVMRQTERESIAYHHQCGIGYFYGMSNLPADDTNTHLPLCCLPACLTAYCMQGSAVSPSACAMMITKDKMAMIGPYIKYRRRDWGECG